LPSIAAGNGVTCIAYQSGAMKCWGANAYGELGNTTPMTSSAPVSVLNVSTATAIAASFGYSCAALQGGNVKCWGEGRFGQLGTANLNNAVSVAAHYEHTCAVLTNQKILCWGNNDWFQLGAGAVLGGENPVSVYGINNARSVATGYYHTCAVLADGKIKCWGGNGTWVLGAGPNITSGRDPVEVGGITTAISIAAGLGHTCAVLADDSLRCWGGNDQGQLGNESVPNGTAVPVTVSGLGAVSSVSAGQTHTCVVLKGGTVSCWGDNAHGELGNDDIADSTVPVSVLNLDHVVQVACGSTHTCALRENGEVWCWGDNEARQLGDGTVKRSRIPVQVQGL
jgi:alpha-tubulin suppressor-like RCC1 family protein